MGILKWLFGPSQERQSDASKRAKTSTVAWDHPEVIPLAAGRGFTFDVVGENQWQDNLSAICGGKCEDGHKREVAAQLVFESNPTDPNAVGVMIDARPVGWIPADKGAEVRSALMALNPDRRAVTCKAKVVGGWDRGDGDEGHFGVKLSLSWPLKVHASRK